MAEISWTDEAQGWVQKIHDYIARDNPDAAYRTVLGIHERAAVLLTFPEIGHRLHSHPDVRVLLYGHYRIADIVKPTRDVDILGVFHGALDIDRYLA